MGNYDGFNYLGAGIFALILVVFVLTVVSGDWKKVVALIKSQLPLLLVMGLLTMFAISNVVTYNDLVLFECPLPGWIEKICGIFRASSRMFYPVYYILFTFLVLQLWGYKERVGRKSVLCLLLLTVAIQLFDLRYVVAQKHQMMEEREGYASILQDQTLEKIARNGEMLILDEVKNVARPSAVWALKNGMVTYFSTANSGSYLKCAENRDLLLQAVFENRDLGKAVIATTDIATALKYLRLPSVSAYMYDGAYYIYKDMEDLERTGNRVVCLGDNIIDVTKNNVTVTDFSEGEWEKGVHKNGDVLRFSYQQDIWDMFYSAEHIIYGEDVFTIVSIKEIDGWIQITVDRNAEVCRYPAILQLE